MKEECKIEYSLLTLEVTGTRKKLERLLKETLIMGLGADADWELQDVCPIHGKFSNDEPECKANISVDNSKDII